MILIPYHNEEESLAVVLEGVQRYVPQEEVVVVDSCCTDKTVLIAKEFGSTVLQAEQKRVLECITLLVIPMRLNRKRSMCFN